ncbi:TraI domain-containing protein [Pseudomonas gingeri]|uniref:MobH family relaxase n=1 Tax=Pseudomonas gingeri TaxID=117681 RepID=UPI0015A0783F|nr:MobH family relaxase [Pseudomonas gingeri]NWD74499.1 TraI domain-containing protein [Pseudomonas gingeri]
MLWRWLLKKPAVNSTTNKGDPGAEYFTPQSATALLSTPRRQKVLGHIWQLASLSRQQFTDLYLAPIERYAELVQQLPASENHHHAYPGGMLDHGLEIVVYALKLRQQHLLPIGAGAEAQAAQTEAWSVTIAYAALLHDIGKIIVDVQVQTSDGAPWHPWMGPLDQPYRFKYVKDRPYKLHGASAGLLLTQILPHSTLNWLISYREPWSALTYVLAGQYEQAGILGELVIQADQASVAQELGGNPTKALAAPKSSLQRRLIEGLRYLVCEQLKLNQSRASDGWLTEEALWLVSKPAADKLRAHLLSQGAEGIPSSNPTLFNVLQDNAIIQVSPEGKAIWTATIQNGKWKKTLTFLKVAPALIWEKAERPPAFTGSVTLEVTAEKNEEDEHTGDLDHPASAYSPLEPTSSWGAPPDWPQSPEQEDIAPAAPPRYITDVPDLDDDQVSQWALALDHPERDTHEATRANAGLIPTERPDPSVAPTDNKTESPPGMAPRSAAASSAKKTAQSNAHTAQPDASPEVLGKTFMKWLRQGVLTNKIIVNDATAKVHSVVGTAFLVSPGIFQRYADEHPETARAAQLHGTNGWRWVQRCFEKLELHRKDEAGRSLWACQIQSSRKARDIKGYLLKDPLLIFTERPYDNPYLQVKE